MSCEYLVINRFPSLAHAEERLNLLAEAGWRVVAVQSADRFSSSIEILLEREKGEPR